MYETCGKLFIILYKTGNKQRKKREESEKKKGKQNKQTSKQTNKKVMTIKCFTPTAVQIP